MIWATEMAGAESLPGMDVVGSGVGSAQVWTLRHIWTVQATEVPDVSETDAKASKFGNALRC